MCLGMLAHFAPCVKSCLIYGDTFLSRVRSSHNDPVPPPAPTVAERLRAAIDAKEIPVRALARKLAGVNATDKQVEVWRRSLNKYLDGTVPSRPRAIKIARTLGKPDDYLIVSRPPRRGMDHRVDDLEATVAELRQAVDDLRRSSGPG